MRFVVTAFSVVSFFYAVLFTGFCWTKPSDTQSLTSTQPFTLTLSPTIQPVTTSSDGGTPISTPKPIISSGGSETSTNAPTTETLPSSKGKDEPAEIKYELYLKCEKSNKLVMHADFEDTLGLPDTIYYPSTATSVQLGDRKSLWIQVKGKTIWNGLLAVSSNYCIIRDSPRLAIKVICLSSDNCVSSASEPTLPSVGEEEPAEIKYELYLKCGENKKLIMHADFEDTLKLSDTKYYPSSATSVDGGDRKSLWIQVKGKTIWNGLLAVSSKYCAIRDSPGLVIEVICKSSDNCEQIKYY